MMMELHADSADECAIEPRSYQQIVNVGAFGNQQKHGEAPEEIERHQPALRAKREVGTAGGGPCNF